MIRLEEVARVSSVETTKELDTAPSDLGFQRIAVWILVGLGVVGSFKGLPYVQRSPIDPTLLLAVVGACFTAARFRRLEYPSRIALTRLAFLWSTFLIGTIILIGTAFSLEKVVLLWSLTLLTATLGASIGWSYYLQRSWVTAWLATGAVALPLLLLFRDTEYSAQFGRLSLIGTSTIGISRVVAVAALSAILLGLGGDRRKRQLLALGGAGVLAVALIGNRGAFVSLVLGLVVVLTFGRRSRGNRLWWMVRLVVPLSIALAIAESLGSRGLSRIARFVTGDAKDAARLGLYDASFQGLGHHPLGVGWGRFQVLTDRTVQLPDDDFHPHNILLEIGAEGGWLALLAFGLVIALALRGFQRNSETVPGMVMLGQFAFWFFAAQTSSDVNGNRALWAMVGIGLAMEAVRADSEPQGRIDHP